ncbi:MAG: PAS domain-containing protein [Cyanobacteria bacterium SZAS-4]|nr:PAS domain-containing protein [Cyanobacteria bacterium SZAS-4]
MRMTLSRKGLLLILLPILVQLGCFIAYDLLVSKAVDLYHNQLYSKEVIGHLNYLFVLLSESALAADGFAISGDKELLKTYESIDKKLNTELSDNAVFFTSSGHSKNYAHLADLINQHHARLSSIILAKQENRPLDSIASDAVNADVKNLWKEMLSTRTEILANEDVRRPLNPHYTPDAFSDLKALTNGGIAASLAIAIGIMFFYSKDIARRLAMMMENVSRLPQGKPLLERVKGDDEIATFDSAFHDMAKELTEARVKERAILDNAIDVICALDANGRFTQVSKSVREGWGKDQDQILQNSAYDMLKPDSHETFRAALTRALESGEKIHCDVQLSSREPVDVLWTGAWSPENQNFYCVVHDVTQERRIERMKREFVGMISHDLRSPLMSVQVFLQLLSSGHFGEMPEQVSKRSRMSASDMSRLINLINNLLDIDRLEEGQMKIFREPVEVQKIMERSQESVDSLAERAGIKIEVCELNEEIAVDEGLIIQVLVNLLSNAVKFSPKNTSILIDYSRNGDIGRFAVIDHGRGIPANKLGLVFERFQQVDELEDARKKKGSGLGLTICKRIVEAHGGTIGVDSVEGEGSTFWFTLPVV